MRKAIAVAVAVTVLALGAGARDAAADGSAREVAASCRELFKSDARKSFDAGLCIGSFTTIHALSSIVDQHQAPLLGFCRPPSVDFTEMVRVFMRHVDSHPQSAQSYYVIEAINALVAAYPCKKG
jgi:hypothetical protein